MADRSITYNILLRMRDQASGVSKTIDKELKTVKLSADQVAGSLNSISGRLSAVSNSSMGNVKNVSNVVDNLKRQYQSLGKEAATASEALENSTKKVTPRFNSLNMSVQQVARELPALAISANTFFLAISNNLPILADSISAARKENQELIASGQKSVPVWKQVAGSLFSWQTALVAGVTILSMYGGEIIDFTKSLFVLSDATDSNKKAFEALRNTAISYNEELFKESNNLRYIYNEIMATTEGTAARKNAIDRLNDTYEKYMPYLLSEKSSLGELNTVYTAINSDLAVSYIIYKDKNIRIMKENIIQAIVAKMQRDLDCRQMARLKAVLASELHNVEIIEKSDCATQQTQENEHLLSSFISAKKIEGCSDKTLAYYRNTIERLLGTLSLAICHISTTDIRSYLSDYQEEHQSSKVTIDNMRRIFSSFFAWLEDEDYIAKSPVRRIHKVKTDSLVKEVLSDEQLEQLRDCCTNKRDLAIIDILASTGIRVGELVKLNREDIDFHERQCVVFGKGNKERVVYFNARTKLHLQQYLNGRTDNNSALFVSLNSPHSRLTISGVEIRIRKLGQSLSMPKVHPHKFRRTLATMAIDKGMPIEQVQRLLGHVRIDTTLHYAIVNQNNVKLAHKKYLG